jgi:hypothetical protein
MPTLQEEITKPVEEVKEEIHPTEEKIHPIEEDIRPQEVGLDEEIVIEVETEPEV